jgi:SAM-dependent methyltransferase
MEKSNKKLVDQTEWENGWDNYRNIFISKPTIDPLLRKYLPKGEKYKFIELGATPGNNLVYFAKTFSYHVTGLDYAGVDLTRQFLDKQNIKNYSLIGEDMFKWNGQESYDVVFSTGVVEHFDPVNTVFDIHKNACKRDGYVVICIPNMRYVNKFIANLFNPGLPDSHNLKMMNPKILKAQFERHYEVLYCNYYKTSLLNIDPNYDYLGNNFFLKKIHRLLRRISSTLRIDNIPNRFFSPNIVIIAQKLP